MRFNKFLYSLFAVIFAVGEWSSLFSSIGLVEVLFFVYLFVFYLILILFLVGFFGVAMALFGSVYIGLPGGQWHILPKRDFNDIQERDKLIGFLREACGRAGVPEH